MVFKEFNCNQAGPFAPTLLPLNTTHPFFFFVFHHFTHKQSTQIGRSAVHYRSYTVQQPHVSHLSHTLASPTLLSGNTHTQCYCHSTIGFPQVIPMTKCQLSPSLPTSQARTYHGGDTTCKRVEGQRTSYHNLRENSSCRILRNY